MRIRTIAFTLGALVAAPVSFPPLGAGAGVARADEVYLREADAPRAVFPDGAASERKTLTLTDSEMTALMETLGKRIDARSYPYFEVKGKQGADVVGFVFLLDIVGQSRPITFAIGVTASGTVKDVEVMVYRESHGDEIREARFRRQFTGKKLGDPLTVDRDIDAISGATISCRSTAYASRKALALAEVLRRRSAPVREAHATVVVERR